MKHSNIPCQIEITKVRANQQYKGSVQCSSAFEHVFELFRIQYIGNITRAILDRL